MRLSPGATIAAFVRGFHVMAFGAQEIRDDNQREFRVDIGWKAPVSYLEAVASGLVLERLKGCLPEVALELGQRFENESLILRRKSPKLS